MAKRILAIDDRRECKGASTLARTYWDGIDALVTPGTWDELWLDHDLGDLEMQFTPDTKRELTGYDVLCFLEENPEYMPKKIVLITDNASGRQRMNQVLEVFYTKGLLERP